jgi:hypothetical protein
MTIVRRIPKEELDDAHLKLCMRVASMLLDLMEKTGVSYATIDARLGRRPGWSRSLINDLINGNTDELRIVSDLSYAMGYTPHITFENPHDS